MHIPAPQWGLDPTQQLVAGVIFAVALAAALVYAARVARQERAPYPLYVMLCAGLVAFGEPFVDVLGHCAFPEQGATPWIHAFDRVVGIYMAPVYFFYFGTFFLVTMRKIAAGVTTKGWWRWYGGMVALALAFEPIPINIGWWTYYGDNQPLMFFGLPIWWAFANTGGALVAGAILHMLLSRRILTGAGTLAIIPLAPVIFMGAHTMMAFPLYVALNSSDSLVVTNLAQLATIAVSLAGVWISGRLVAADAPRLVPDRGEAPEAKVSA
jgi:hypothetical protein